MWRWIKKQCLVFQVCATNWHSFFFASIITEGILTIFAANTKAVFCV
jgi:hypothetical protein